MNTEDTTFSVLKHDLSRYLPIRIVLRKDEDGTISGLTENSFSMGESQHNVRIWWSGKAYSMLGEHEVNGVSAATYNMKPGDLLFDPLDDNCPIEIDWQGWLAATDKYSKRNAKFTVKR